VDRKAFEQHHGAPGGRGRRPGRNHLHWKRPAHQKRAAWLPCAPGQPATAFCDDPNFTGLPVRWLDVGEASTPLTRLALKSGSLERRAFPGTEHQLLALTPCRNVGEGGAVDHLLVRNIGHRAPGSQVAAGDQQRLPPAAARRRHRPRISSARRRHQGLQRTKGEWKTGSKSISVNQRAPGLEVPSEMTQPARELISPEPISPDHQFASRRSQGQAGDAGSLAIF